MSLLVALDFSSVADTQIRIVSDLARPGREVVLLHVAEPDPSFIGMEAGPGEVRGQVAEEYRRGRARLHEMADRLRAEGHEARALVVRGPTIRTILEQADVLGAEVIVVGSHGHGKLFDVVVGSVSAGVIRKAKVPVLVVPSRMG